MKKLALAVLSAVIGVMAFASLASAQAQQGGNPPAAAAQPKDGAKGLPPVVIALFDKEALFRESAAGKDFRKQLDELRNKFQGDLSHQQEELKKKDADLRNRQALLSAEAFEAERKKFEAEVQGAQSKFEERNRQIQGAIQNAEQEIFKATTPILADIMRAKGATLLLDKAVTLISANDFDITSEVVKKLDSTLPKIKLELKPVPAPGGANAGPNPQAQTKK